MAGAQTKPAPGQLSQAVANANLDAVKRLLDAGAEPNDPDERGVTPLLVAAAGSQFRIANLLVDFGADIWALKKFGLNVGIYTYNSRVVDDSDEGRARALLIERLRAAGFPWPPPHANQMESLVQAGKWPPAGAMGVSGTPARRP